MCTRRDTHNAVFQPHTHIFQRFLVRRPIRPAPATASCHFTFAPTNSPTIVADFSYPQTASAPARFEVSSPVVCPYASLAALAATLGAEDAADIAMLVALIIVRLAPDYVPVEVERAFAQLSSSTRHGQQNPTHNRTERNQCYLYSSSRSKDRCW
jgi:hypothetical protein